MSVSSVLFYILSGLAIGSALLAVASRSIFRSAVFLLFSLIGVAGLYFWLHYEFIAAVQIIVYVGGIVVLIIFSIFLTQQIGVDLPRPIKSRSFFAALSSLAGFLLIALQFLKHTFRSDVAVKQDTGMQAIGHKLLSTGVDGYVLPFELVSVLLLAAMIGCIVIAIKPVNPES